MFQPAQLQVFSLTINPSVLVEATSKFISMSESIHDETRVLLYRWFGFQSKNVDQNKFMIRFTLVFKQHAENTFSPAETSRTSV